MGTYGGVDKRRAIAEHFLFRQLVSSDIDRILALSVERHYDDGQVIFQKGEEGSSMMIVLEGRVLISVIAEDGKELTLNYIEPGEILGEIALIDGKKRSANATAVGACTLLYITRAEFIPFLRKNPGVAIHLLMILCEKLRATSNMAENIGLLPVPARLARLIIRIAHADEKKLMPGQRVRMNLSQREMGNLIGTSRESVNKTFSQWQAQGLIQLRQDYVVVLEPKRLSWLSETEL